MDWLATLPGIDLIAGLLLTVAVVRGIWIGAIREAFSLAAVAVALIATRLATTAAASWLAGHAPFDLEGWSATALAGIGIFLLSLLAVGWAGRLLRASIHAVGLGFFDRLAGGALGALEGGLLVAVGIALSSAALGQDHAVLENSHTLAAYERATEWASHSRLADVAAPPLEERR